MGVHLGCDLRSDVNVLTANEEKAERFFQELLFFIQPGQRVLLYPSWEIAPFEKISPPSEVMGERWKGMDQLISDPRPGVVVASLRAVVQRVPPREVLQRWAFSISPEQEFQREELIARLEGMGYGRVSLVTEVGEFAVRGHLIDVFSPSAAAPLRVEFSGDRVESVRAFDPDSQRSSEPLERVRILPVREVLFFPEFIEQAIQKLGAHLGEAFVAKYPESVYDGAVYSEMASAYLQTNQTDKMLVAGTKALEKNPDNVDVLPIMAWAIPRRANPQTADGAQDLKKAQDWAKHGITLLTSMPKPAEMDDAAFSKAKNDKLALCHDGLGVAAARTGKYEDAIAELTQSIQLSSTPDPVDYYLLGVSDEQGSHFTNAIADFTKCSADGPMQAQCKGLLDETKKKAANSLEVPR